MICQNLVEELEEAYTLITVVEEEMVENAKKLDLSLAEVHMLQAIGKNKEKGRTISELAAERYITLSSVTIAVNKLARKGYVLKTKAQRDGRVVYARLTEQGERVDRLYRRFHQSLAHNMVEGFSEEEKQVLVKGIGRLNNFLQHRIEKMEASK